MRIAVSLETQTLKLFLDDRRSIEYRISTAARGPGSTRGSYCTPLGAHRVKLKIGGGCPAGTVFAGRRPTGELFSEDLRSAFPARDWILSRILWLQGLERGINRGGQVDTLRRFVYIHGTADEDRIGQPASHGCIRMKNEDVIRLFELVPNGIRVDIA